MESRRASLWLTKTTNGPGSDLSVNYTSPAPGHQVYTNAAVPAIQYDPNDTIPDLTRHQDPVRWVSAEKRKA